MLRRKGPVASPSDVLPGYADLEEIGGGAFATVYRATEIDTGRPVALKILKVDTVHPHLLETFTQEIQALGKVSDHPHIVTLYRPLTTADGRPVLVLELCRESLANQVRRAGPLPAEEVVTIGIKVAGALETAHRHGFLHRDMKPQNILITQFGEPALADFGVAALQASAQATAGVFGFTTLHAAPEILEGHHLSPATDVYGLASTMYQLLAGLAPFATFDNEAPASVILRIIRDPVRPLRAEGIPVGLSDLLEAALAKTPDGRPPSAAEFAEALQRVEAYEGWPHTAYTAWGSETPAPTAGPMSRPIPAVRPAPAPPHDDFGVADGRQPDLQPSAPSIRMLDEPVKRRTTVALPSEPPAAEPPAAAPAPTVVPDAATSRPSIPLPPPSLPDLPAAQPPPAPPEGPLSPSRIPPAPPLPESRSPGRASPPGPPPAPPLLESGSPGRASPPGPPPAPPEPPPPPPAHTRPSLAEPGTGPRNVVVPNQFGRGQPNLPVERPADPLPPLRPAGSPAAQAEGRPVFVDPEDTGAGAYARGPSRAWTGLGAPTVYEQTMLPGGPATPRRRPARTQATAAQPGRSPILGNAAAIGGVALAVLVVAAALLLIVGVI